MSSCALVTSIQVACQNGSVVCKPVMYILHCNDPLQSNTVVVFYTDTEWKSVICSVQSVSAVKTKKSVRSIASQAEISKG